MQLDAQNQSRTSQVRASRWAPLALCTLLLLSACASNSVSISKGNTPQQQRAMAMWQERCKKSGEFIHKTVEGVEGVHLVNVRTRTNMGELPADQFALDDPYGSDVTGDGYIEKFLRNVSASSGTTEFLPVFRFVEAIDPKDGRLYRFTGRVEEPWQRDKSYLKGHLQFVLDRTSISKRSARYAVKFDDISTREEREHWIAGSSLKVIDLETQEVIAERVGYMVDWAQGSRAGARSPWLLATDNACPAFSTYRGPGRAGSVAQLGQTIKFVKKVLKPLP